MRRTASLKTRASVAFKSNIFDHKGDSDKVCPHPTNAPRAPTDRTDIHLTKPQNAHSSRFRALHFRHIPPRFHAWGPSRDKTNTSPLDRAVGRCSRGYRKQGPDVPCRRGLKMANPTPRRKLERHVFQPSAQPLNTRVMDKTSAINSS